jgi:hypothetical protein
VERRRPDGAVPGRQSGDPRLGLKRDRGPITPPAGGRLVDPTGGRGRRLGNGTALPPGTRYPASNHAAPLPRGQDGTGIASSRKPQTRKQVSSARLPWRSLRVRQLRQLACSVCGSAFSCFPSSPRPSSWMR